MTSKFGMTRAQSWCDNAEHNPMPGPIYNTAHDSRFQYAHPAYTKASDHNCADDYSGYYQGKKRRLCYCHVPTAIVPPLPDGWYDSLSQRSCTQACTDHGLKCSELMMLTHNHRVDQQGQARNRLNAWGRAFKLTGFGDPAAPRNWFSWTTSKLGTYTQDKGGASYKTTASDKKYY
jgi:hypothetical protein